MRLLGNCLLWIGMICLVAMATAAPPKGAPSKVPTAIKLPAPSDQGMVKIGPFPTADKSDCVVYLHAPARSKAMTARFALREEPQTDGARWLVSLVKPTGATEAGDAIAQLQRRGDSILFSWLPAAADNPDSGKLANCILEISPNNGRHFVALRKPVVGAPLTFGFDAPMIARWELPDAPDPTLIKVELRLAKREPRYRFVGSSTIDAARGSTWIEFMDRRTTEALKLKVECDWKRDSLQLQATPYFEMPGEKQPVKFSPATHKKAVERARFAVQQLEAQLNALPATGGKPKGKTKGPTPAPSVANFRDALQKQLTAARAVESQLADVLQIKEAIDGEGKLLVRATVEVDGQTLELLQTK